MISYSPTPVILTDILQQAGWLKKGRVTAVEEHKSAAFNSQLTFLRLAYSADAPSDLPTRFVIKRNIAAAWASEAGAEEVKFYKLVATLPDHPPVLPPCYAAAYEAATGDSYLLLQDLSASHAPPATRDQQISLDDATLTPEKMIQVIDTLAQFHAFWWQHPLLYCGCDENRRFQRAGNQAVNSGFHTEQSIGSGHFPVGYWSRNAERFALYLERRQRAWASLVTTEDWLPTDVRELYERVFAGLPHHWKQDLEPRFRNQSHLTLVHGDAYFANFLCPNPGQTGNSYLLDWQSPTVDLAGYDLANLLATFWTPAQRHQEAREQRLLQRYYQTLCVHGVTGYTWEELLTDYRSGLIYWLLVPVQDRDGGAGKDYWWPKMQCLVAAFQEWSCAAMLQPSKYPQHH